MEGAGGMWQREKKFLFKLALPIVMMSGSTQGMTFTDTIFLGHLGTSELAAAALGNTYAAFLQIFMLGMATALDTLGAQAFGAQKKGLPGTSLATWATTSFIVMTFLCVLPMVGLSYAHTVASELLGQTAQVSELMAVFCSGLIPGVPFVIWSSVLLKYMQVQNVVLAPAVVTLGTFLANIGLNFIFIAWKGYPGAPLATTCSRVLQCLLMALLVWGLHHHQHSMHNVRSVRSCSSWLLRLLFSGAEAGEQTQQQLGEQVPDGNGAPGLKGAKEEIGLAKVDMEGALSQKKENGVEGKTKEGRDGQDGGGWEGREGSDESDADVKRLVQGRLQGKGGLQSEQPTAGPDSANEQQQQQQQQQQHWEEQQDLEEQPLLPACLGSVQHSSFELAGHGGLHHRHAQPHVEGGGGDQQRGGNSSHRLQRLLHLLRDALRPPLLGAFFKLGLPGSLMMAFEQGSFCMTIVMAGKLRNNAMTGAHSAFLNVTGLSYVACPLAVGIAASIRVGNLLGAGQPSSARMFAWMCVGAVATFVTFNACILLLTRHVIGHAFSEDEEVIKIMAMIAPIATLHQMSDGLMGSAQGVLRGCGRQSLLMFYNLGGFWGCGVLLGSTLCFRFDMGVLGLWIGIASGTTATAILNVATLVFLDWRKESKRAQDTLIHAAGEPGQETNGSDDELQSLRD